MTAITARRGTVGLGLCSVTVLAGLLPSSAWAEDLDVQGVLLAAQELPHAAVTLRRPEGATPPEQITPINVLEGGVREYAFPAFLDTGASGILISRDFHEFLQIEPQRDAAGNPVSFYDVTSGGETRFHVSEPLYVSIGSYPVLQDEPPITDLPAVNAYYNDTVGPVRAQLGLTETPPFQEPRNVVGMPALIDKVMVVDSTPYNRPNGEIASAIITSVYDPGDAAIPETDRTVRLSYGEFSRFTRLEPAAGNGIEGPVLTHNPFIGPEPLAQDVPPGSPPPIVISRPSPDAADPHEASGSWLLDTGAQITIMSESQARALNIEYRTDDQTGDRLLFDLDTDRELPGQYVLELGGAGESTNISAFALDELRVPTDSGDIVFHDVPVAVLSINLMDPDTEEMFELDGVIGMNLFLPTLDLELREAASAFDFLVFDEAAGELRLQTGEVVPEPAAAGTLLILAAGGLLQRRRRRRRDPRA